MQHNDVMPPKVAEAVAAVMAEVPKLAKGERNSHGNYNFASIDDFLEAVRPIMAKHKLIISSDEDDFEVIGDGRDAWLRMRFAFSAHCGGETYGPMRRSIMIMAKMGSQAFGAGQSYAEKQFLRSLFKIATGEGANIDADSHPQDTLARTKSAPTPIVPPNGWEEWGRDIVTELDGAKDGAAIEAIKQRELKMMKAAAKAAPKTYAEIGEAFARARADTTPEQKAA